MGEVLQHRLKQARFRSVEQEAMLNLIVAASYMLNYLERICNEFGITQPQYNVLRILRGAYPGGHSRCEVIERMVDRAPDVTRLIDRLERQGLVARERSSDDRRLSITRITGKGLELLERMQPTIDDVEVMIASRLTPEECAAISAGCEKLYNGKEQ
jgi:DNA-binding MarR family transcriptional regulator